MMAGIPDRLYIDKADRALYEDDSVENEVFTGVENKDRFLFAMAVGFKHRVRRPLDTREGYLRAEYLRPEDEALIDALALLEGKSPDVLADRKEVFRIAEEYAHGGIRLLHGAVTSGQPGSYLKRLELELFELLENLPLPEDQAETCSTMAHS